MTHEQEIEILVLAGCTKFDAKRHLKNGCIIFQDLEDNLESYLDEWDVPEEDRFAYRQMVQTKKPMPDWGVAEKDGCYYYIEYVL